jgi:hypothetical protein
LEFAALLLSTVAIVNVQAADHPVITVESVQPTTVPPPLGDTIVARSGAAEDIQRAVLSAHPGDTIVIPEGRFAFHGQVFLPDGLSIRGAGRDKTWIA